MDLPVAGYLVILGILLALLGVIGHVTHPERIHTPLIMGAASGVLWVLCGIFSARRIRWSWSAAVTVTALVAFTFLWQASLGWLAVIHGETERVFGSLILTLMFAVAAFMMALLLKSPGLEQPQKTAAESE